MFSRKPVKEYKVNQDFNLSPWLDGDFKQVRIRERYVKDVCKYYEKLQRRTRTSRAVYTIIQELMPMHMGYVQKTDFYHRFVDSKATKEHFVVFTNPKSTDIVTFCHHISLTLGTYVTELDFLGLTPIQALEKAGLLTYLPHDTDEKKWLDCKEILIRYLEEELQ